ncbi:hypothetical protein B0A48_17158 [Cryoendolithus antarcticus]|uniref:CCHC-type domain-containing protein n=1 Tax=Cryoendolithus antarcticus TaxID=1507870 RepID=A0A1V8SC04_9PEZI|nr:hypothetical protein B0A48_17158 [Cryoendolithus antarcticus]
MSRKERRVARKRKRLAADADLNDSRTANTGRKRKRNDNAIDVARQDAKRTKMEEEDSDYVPFQASSGSAQDESGDEYASLDSGEIDSSETPGQLNVVTRQRSKPQPGVAQTVDLRTLHPEALRSRALRHREKHPGWSSAQILKRISTGASNEQVRDAAQHVLASLSKSTLGGPDNTGADTGYQHVYQNLGMPAEPTEQHCPELSTGERTSADLLLRKSRNEATGELRDEEASLENGEVDLTASRERLQLPNRQQSGSPAGQSTPTRLRQDVSLQHKLSTLRPKLLRIHATDIQKRHSDWSLLQVLEHVEANAPNEKVRCAANRVTADLAPMAVSPASRPASIAVEPYSEALDLGLNVSVPLNGLNFSASDVGNPDDQKRRNAQSTAKLPQEMMHADVPAPIALTFEHMRSKKLVQAVEAVLVKEPTWSVQLILKFLEITSGSPKIRNSAADTLQTWFKVNSFSGEARSALVSMLRDRVKFRTPAARTAHEERNAVFQTTRIHLDNVEPPPLQAALRLHMRTSETGLTPEAAMRKVLEEGDKAFKKFATQSLMKQHQKCVLKLNKRYQIDLAQLFTDVESLRADLDVTKLCAVTEKSGDEHEKDFGRLLRKLCAERPDSLAAEHLYDLMCRPPDADHHILACEAMSRYLSNNVIKEQAHSGDSAQDQRHTLTDPEDDTRTQRESPEPAAGTATNEEASSRSILPDDIPRRSVFAELNSAIDNQFLQLGDLSPEDQALQYRYFGLSDLGDIAGAPGDECDVCGNGGHAEEQCAELWTTFKIDPETFVPVSRRSIVVSCYNCGKANDHWGDDCKTLPDYVIKDIMHDTWSAVNAERYILAAEKTAGRNRVHDEEESMHGRDGGIQAHQLAQLGDWL